MGRLMNIGFGNLVNTDKVIAVVSSDSAPSKRRIQQAKENCTLIDATQGRKTKSIIFTSDDKLILSALNTDTLAGRFQNLEEGEEKK